MVEPDAEWHSTDNKHHSLGYHPRSAPSIPARAPSAQRAPSQVPAPRGDSEAAYERSVSHAPIGTANSNTHSASNNVFVIDSDDEDDQVRAQLVHRESQSTQHSQSQHESAPRGQTSQVIDLTLSSDDEQPVPPPPRAPSLSVAEKGKRKAPDSPVPYSRGLVNGDKAATFSNGVHYPSSPKRLRLEDSMNNRGSLIPLQSLGALSTSGDRVAGNVYHGGSGEGHNISGSPPSFYDRSVSGGQSASTAQRPPYCGVGLRQSSSSAYDPVPGFSSSLRSPLFSSPTSSTSNALNRPPSVRRNDDYNVGGRRSSLHSELYGATPPPSGDSNLYSGGPSITPPTPNLTNTTPARPLSRMGKLDDASRYQSPTSYDFQYNYNSPRTAALNNYSYDEPPHESSRYRDRMSTRPLSKGGGGNDDSADYSLWSPGASPRGLQ